MAFIKKNAFLIVCLIAAVIILWDTGIKDIYAANIALTGDTQGIHITPSDGRLFYLDNMLPGEAAESGVEISNTDLYAFQLNVSVKAIGRETPPEADLLEVLDITVYMDGVEIKNFPAKGGSHDLGRFLPGETAFLEIQLMLDGRRTGNEYQGQSAELQWIFDAVSEYRVPDQEPDEESDQEPEEEPVQIPEEEPVQEPDEIIIEDVPIPLELPEIIPDPPVSLVEPEITTDSLEPRAEPEIIIEDTLVPLVNPEMPKTGEPSLAIYIITGILAIGWGFVLVLWNRYKKNRV